MVFEQFFNPGRKQQDREDELMQKQLDHDKEQNVSNAGLQEDNTELMQSAMKSDLIRWQQEMNPDLMDLIMHLRGVVQTEDGKLVKLPDKKPLCNELFINDVVIPQCKPFLNKNFINTNFTEDQINMTLRHTWWEIKDNMADGFDKYDIEFANYDIVLRLIKNLQKAAAFRALKGWTKKEDSRIIKRVEGSWESAGDNGQKKKGLLGI